MENKKETVVDTKIAGYFKQIKAGNTDKLALMSLKYANRSS